MAEPRATNKTAPELPRAVSSRVHVLKTRADFLRAARGRRVACEGFILQAVARPSDPSDAKSPDMRIGFTCSKKVGNAVARNRAKRRLREIARLTLPEHGQPGFDYVLIGRARRTAEQDFTAMQKALRNALAKLHGRAAG